MLEPMRASMRRTATALLLGFVIVALALGYWQVARPDLATSGANPRVAQAQKEEPRGRILDRTGAVLASSSTGPDGSMQRHYTDATLAPVIGFHSTRFGNAGLEAAFDAQLRGQQSPNIWDQLLGGLLHSPARTSDLVLTIDRQIQDTAAQQLGDTPGAIVALDPKTGAVLAMASTPSFDPNATDDQLAKIQQDPADPVLDRPIQAQYVPGSVFKTVTASAAIDLGLVDLNQPFTCTKAVTVGSYSVNCNNSYPLYTSLTYKQAFAWSNNRVFGLTGLLLGFPGPINPWLSDTPPGPYPWTQPGASIQPSADKLVQYAERFGFDKPIPFDLPVLPSQVKNPDTPWTPELLVQTSFGQGQILVTPLQMALAAATEANGGRVPTPYLVSQVQSDGVTQQLHTPGEWFSQAVSSNTASVMTTFFEEGTVNGYAEPAAIPGIKVGGKTGTAEVGDGTSHAWFIGFAPADNPLVAVAVIMEHKGSGTTYATPAGKVVMQKALQVYKRPA